MGIQVIVGAGVIGRATALELVAKGHLVRMVSRSGSGPEDPRIERISADASDRPALVGLTVGADALYDCANPPYHRWPELWPAIAAACLSAAERSGAVLVTMGNLYGYGPSDRPMTEDDPLVSTGRKGRVRAAMWSEALAAHRAGRVRATEARASDYFGTGAVGSSHFGRNMSALMAGRLVRVVGDPDQPHSWTYVPDVGRALAVLGTQPRAWGRAWHVPTAPPSSQREMAERFCRLAGAPAPRIGRIPAAALAVAGLFSPELREVREVRYQFDRPFVVDSSAFTQEFGLEPTPVEDALRATLSGVRPSTEPAAP
ncbi:MAG: NAD-dependent epimerase/dehydratase family protein [Acidimicrobiales bacterium]